jgi:hypothetical protein
MSVAFRTPGTSAGIAKPPAVPFPTVPRPNWPFASFPQHCTVWLESRAQVWRYPAEMVVALLIPTTGTGVEEPVNLPLPSWPKSLYPQHCMPPSAKSAQVWRYPAEMAVALVMPYTKTGVVDETRLPFPS